MIRSIILLLLLAGPFLTGCSGDGLKKDQDFKTQGEFDAAIEKAELVYLGRFQEKWPARIVSITRGEGGVILDLPEQSRHEYTGLDGYTVYAVVLERTDGEMMGIVLRDREK